MISFNDFLIEQNNSITVYHGDNIKNITINNNFERFFHKNANLQEGIGVYFTTNLDTAAGYGKYITQTKILKAKTIPSRDSIEDHVSTTQLVNLLKCIAKSDNNLWVMFTDYGYEVETNKQIQDIHYKKIITTMKSEQVRNFQIEICQYVGVEVFVKCWLKVLPNIWGTYNEELQFYALFYNDSPIEEY